MTVSIAMTAGSAPGAEPQPAPGDAGVVGDPGAGSGASPRRLAYYVYLLRAGVALALGVALLLAGSGLTNLATFVAVYWVVAALVTLRWAGVHREARARIIGFLAGATALGAGVALAFRGPLSGLFSEGALLDLFGATAIVTGALRLSGLLHDDQLAGERPRRRYRLVGGSLDVLLGVALLAADDRTSSNIRIVVVLWALTTGTLLLLDGVVMRRDARRR